MGDGADLINKCSGPENTEDADRREGPQSEHQLPLP